MEGGGTLTGARDFLPDDVLVLKVTSTCEDRHHFKTLMQDRQQVMCLRQDVAAGRLLRRRSRLPVFQT